MSRKCNLHFVAFAFAEHLVKVSNGCLWKEIGLDKNKTDLFTPYGGMESNKNSNQDTEHPAKFLLHLKNSKLTVYSRLWPGGPQTSTRTLGPAG